MKVVKASESSSEGSTEKETVLVPAPKPAKPAWGSSTVSVSPAKTPFPVQRPSSGHTPTQKPIAKVQKTETSNEAKPKDKKDKKENLEGVKSKEKPSENKEKTKCENKDQKESKEPTKTWGKIDNKNSTGGTIGGISADKNFPSLADTKNINEKNTEKLKDKITEEKMDKPIDENNETNRQRDKS